MGVLCVSRFADSPPFQSDSLFCMISHMAPENNSVLAAYTIAYRDSPSLHSISRNG